MADRKKMRRKLRKENIKNKDGRKLSFNDQIFLKEVKRKNRRRGKTDENYISESLLLSP